MTTRPETDDGTRLTSLAIHHHTGVDMSDSPNSHFSHWHWPPHLSLFPPAPFSFTRWNSFSLSHTAPRTLCLARPVPHALTYTVVTFVCVLCFFVLFFVLCGVCLFGRRV